MLTDSMPEPEKASSGMEARPSGSAISCRPPVPWNAPSPSSDTESGSVTFWMFWHPEKASAPTLAVPAAGSKAASAAPQPAGTAIRAEPSAV